MMVDPGCTVMLSGYVVTDEGEIVSVTEWIDSDGEECEAGDAVACVAGPTRRGEWLSVKINRDGLSRLN